MNLTLSKRTSGGVIAEAATLGLASGLIDLSTMIVLDAVGMLNKMDHPLVPEMAWINPLSSIFLFVILGSGIAIISNAVPFFAAQSNRNGPPWFWVTSYVGVSSWLSLISSGRLTLYGRVALALGLTTAFCRWQGKHSGLGLLKRVLVPSIALFVAAGAGIYLAERSFEHIAISRLPTEGSTPPNFLVIIVDTLRSDHLATYGYSRKISPNIDQMAEEGVLFENAFSASSWTLPSHASILTGLFPHEHQAEVTSFPRGNLTLGEALMKHGYETAAFSANKTVFSRSLGFGRGFLHFEDYSYTAYDIARLIPLVRSSYDDLMSFTSMDRMRPALAPIKDSIGSTRHAPEINAALLRWLEPNRKGPFFAVLNYFDVHERNGVAPSMIQSPEYPQGSDIDRYDSSIRFVDAAIGKLMAELKSAGLAENTIVLITSDHGEAFGEHHFWGHGHSVYREEIQVPLIMWGPKFLPRSLRVNGPVTNASIPATVMDLSQVGEYPVFRGPSLALFWEQPSLAEYWPEPMAELLLQRPHGYGRLTTLITERLQYIAEEGSNWKVYNWQDDPAEVRNLLAGSNSERMR
jgi:arylsulfatase A-like enzyme